MARENFVPKNRIPVFLQGVVTSDVFPKKYLKKVGDDFVEDGDGFVFNVEIPTEGAPPIGMQLQTLVAPAKGDTIDFPITLELLLKSKYSIRGSIVIKGPAKPSGKHPEIKS